MVDGGGRFSAYRAEGKWVRKRDVIVPIGLDSSLGERHMRTLGRVLGWKQRRDRCCGMCGICTLHICTLLSVHCAVHSVSSMIYRYDTHVYRYDRVYLRVF